MDRRRGSYCLTSREEIDVSDPCINVRSRSKDGEATVDVCKAWEDMKRKVAKEATEKTQEEILLRALNSLMRTLHLSAEQAMAALEVPEAKRSGSVAKL